MEKLYPSLSDEPFERFKTRCQSAFSIMCSNPVTPFDIFHIPAIHPPVETSLVEVIMDNIRNHIGMTTSDIALMGIDYYQSKIWL